MNWNLSSASSSSLSCRVLVFVTSLSTVITEFKIYDATVTKTSFKIASSGLLIFFVIMSICLNLRNFPGTEFGGVVLNLRQKIQIRCLVFTATRASSQHINLRYFNRFETISTFLIWQGCGSSSKVTLVGTAPNTPFPSCCMSQFQSESWSQPFKWKWVAYSYANQTAHFSFNSWAPRLTKETETNSNWEMAYLGQQTKVLHKTSNLAISRCCFADDGKEIDKSEKRTRRAWKAIVIPPNSNTFPDWRRTCHVPLVKTQWRPRANKTQWRPRETTPSTLDLHVIRSCILKPRQICMPAASSK